MEDDTQSTSKTSPIISVAAVLGLAVAAIAAALGGVALSKISSTAENINARIEKNQAVELEIKKLGDRLDSLALQLEELKSSSGSKMSDLRAQTQSVVTQIGQTLNDTRAEVAKNREALEKLASRQTAAKPAQTKTAQAKEQPQPAEAQPQDAAQTPAAKTYKIQSGDTFARLAKKFKTTAEAIAKANPSVNPSRLKIGQEINLP